MPPSNRKVYSISDSDRIKLIREDQLILAGLFERNGLEDPDPTANYGEVFTRKWVVEFILDLVGYVPERDLGKFRLVEPSCGQGAFLVPIVERLIQSSKTHKRSLQDLGPCIRAFDLLKSNVQVAKTSVTSLLYSHQLSRDKAEKLSEEWIACDDFLLNNDPQLLADFVVGNPPYIRLENVNRRTMEAYRKACLTMRGRADIYVGFIERALRLLKAQGKVAFICADRWMRNQYGAELREMVSKDFSVESLISLHEVDAFEEQVAAYPSIFVLGNRSQGKVAVVDTTSDFSSREAKRVSQWVRKGRRKLVKESNFEASRVDHWFSGKDFWPAASPQQLSVLADLESRYPLLQDPTTGTRVGIGVATGCDEVFITSNPHLVEEERLLPILKAPDLVDGSVRWSRKYLVNPWNGKGLVDLSHYPRLARYFNENSARLKERHVAKKRPDVWFRTIDRVDDRLTERRKLLLPDIKAASHPVLEEGDYYPHHNLYYVVSDQWDLEVLGGLLLSDVANLFVGAYCVRMRGGTFRFQAQYIRRIRVPWVGSIKKSDRENLTEAFRLRDRELATEIAKRIYGIDPDIKLIV